MEHAWVLPLTVLLSGFAFGDTGLDSIQYVGCFELSYSLGKDYHEHMIDISLQGCLDTCQNQGSPRYVGIESSDHFCYCGNDIAEESVKREDALCNIRCSNISSHTCGGDWLMSLYDTHKHPPQDHNLTVSFLVGISAGIRVYNSSSLPEFDTVMVTTNAWAYTVDYHYSRKLVFANTRGKLIRASVSPSFGSLDTMPSLVRDLSQCDGFAVDWVSDKIYWFDCKTHRPPVVMAMDLDGSNNEVVMPLVGDPRGVKRVEIDPYNGMLIWQADGVIESLNLTSKEFHANLSKDAIVVRALALERSTQKVYFVGVFNQISQLFSMNYTGGNLVRVFFFTQMQSVFGLGIHGGFIYWVNYAMSTDIIYKAPLHKDGGREIKMIQTVNKAVWHMRVVHQDIQSIPAKDPCVNQKCAMFCKLLTPTTPVCQCSEGYELGTDKKSCLLIAPDLPIIPHNPTPTTTTTTTAATTTKTTTTTTTEAMRDIRYGNVTYVGCFGTSYASNENRYFIHYVTLDECISRCVEEKSRYAGIAASDMECYCGNQLATSMNSLPDHQCNERCLVSPGLELPCGGDYIMSLYDISMMLPNEESIGEEDNVNFLVGHTHRVAMYNSKHLLFSRQQVNTPLLKWAYAVDFHYNKSLMFTSTRDALYKFPLFNSDPQLRSLSKVFQMRGCEGFAVDWVYDRIFWADCSSPRTFITVVDLNGDNPTTVGNGLGEGIIKRMEIDPYSGLLFWIRGSVTESIDTSRPGQNVRQVPLRLSARGIALDILNKRLFYIGVDNRFAELISVDYEGNDPITHLKMGEMSNIYGLGVLRGFAYWINYQSMDILYKAPLESQQSSTYKQLKVFNTDDSVWHMKVVDPELQSPLPLSGPCLGGGSICEAQTVVQPQSNVGGAVLIAVFIMIGGVLMAVLIMFLTDMKYWRLLRARIPYSRENAMDPEIISSYETGDDTVNLL